MDLSSATAAGQQGTRSNVRCFRVSSRSNKQRDGSVGAERPTGNAVTRVYNGHAMMSMTKRADSLQVLADSDVSNNLFDSNVCRCWTSEKHVPRSQFEVRLATGTIVKTEKRVLHARLSYKYRVFVEELLVLDLDEKFDMVLGMPWLARHDPIIDWEKRTVVRFGRRGATESDGPVSAADTPNGASEPPIETVTRAAVSGCST
ncbi:reverse transcriptase [Phytophthora megakarya]|uniref:Reverse transcriptase n=1 Tax=Phytophthora megakarya TaxID=4795 RepID=A0A225UTE9_9STRA|nr:reverse transcriptase [Phytophthora megakarya]